MVAFRVRFEGEQVGPKFARQQNRLGANVHRAARGAAQDVRDKALTLARADIKKAGNFGKRWTEGLQATLTEGGGSIRLNFTHDQIGFNVHQFGATIKGKPMLWIPLSTSFGGDSAAQGVRARDFPGGLFRVDRKSGEAPLLLSLADRQPKYFGKASVHVPKRFHVIEIIKKTGQEMGRFYTKRLKQGG